jgi:hypothetical protein
MSSQVCRVPCKTQFLICSQAEPPRVRFKFFPLDLRVGRSFGNFGFGARHSVQLIDIHARGILLLSSPVVLGKADAQQTSLVVQVNFMQDGAGAIICVGPDQRNYLQFGMPMLDTTSSTDVLCAIELLLNKVETWEARLIYNSNVTATSRLGLEHWMKSV